MSFLVRTIRNGTGMDDFLSLPHEIYKNDPNWIPPQRTEMLRVLDPYRNPYFDHASLKIYVCYSGKMPVSRAVMVFNHLYWKKWNRRSVFFGFFESFNNPEAVILMFERIRKDCRSLGAEYLEGPFNPNHYSELGILTDDFNSAPVFFETYNPPYYIDLLKASGFNTINEFHTRINRNIKATIDKNFRSNEQSNHTGNINIRKFNIFRYRRDLEILRDINNDAFENNVYFLPLSNKEYRFLARFLFLITAPSLILFAEYDNKPVGAVQFVINFNSIVKSIKRKINVWDLPFLMWKRGQIKELIIFSAGVKKEFRNKRIMTAMFRYSLAILRKYSTLCCTWVSDEKLAINLDKLLEMRPLRHYAIFSASL